MKAILISIQPKWCEFIASGKKTVEVRKTAPKLETPFKVYIYCTLPPKEELFTHSGIREYANELIRLQDGKIVYDYGMRLCCDIENRPYSQDNFLCQKVIGEFVCDEIFPIRVFENGSIQDYVCHGIERSCVPYDKISSYIGNDRTGYGWHISNLVIYDKPKKLKEFKKAGFLTEEDWLAALYPNTHCHYEAWTKKFEIKKPPQSWCYVEELKGVKII